MAALFSLGKWNSEHGGQRWEFDVTPALGELAKIGQGSEEPMDETLYAAKLHILSASGSKLRAAPDTSAGLVTVLAQGVYAAICGNQQTNDNYNWAHVTVNGQTGWVALESTDGNMTTLARIEPTDPAPEPEPTPDPEPEPTPEPAPASWLEFLRNQREMLIAQRTAIDIQLEYIEQEMGTAA